MLSARFKLTESDKNLEVGYYCLGEDDVFDIGAGMHVG